jgi:hypothetical protein
MRGRDFIAILLNLLAPVILAAGSAWAAFHYAAGSGPGARDPMFLALAVFFGLICLYVGMRGGSRS